MLACMLVHICGCAYAFARVVRMTCPRVCRRMMDLRVNACQCVCVSVCMSVFVFVRVQDIMSVQGSRGGSAGVIIARARIGGAAVARAAQRGKHGEF